MKEGLSTQQKEADKDLNILALFTLLPVSYTHLDVYKRQLLFVENWKSMASFVVPNSMKSTKIRS